MMKYDADLPITPKAPRVAGRKDDGGKIDMTLLLDTHNALEQITRVMQWAITDKKPVPYERGSWLGVEDGVRRYRAAELRHIMSEARQEAAGLDAPRDAETQLLEAAHIATDAVFALELLCRELLKMGVKL